MKATVLVPGKVMLAGEYSVLWGGRSLAFTLDRFLTVSAQPAEAGCISLLSDRWEQELRVAYPMPAHQLNEAELLVRAAHEACKQYQLAGLRITVSSGFSVSDGFGSSSALCLGTLLATAALAGKTSEADRLQAARYAFAVQKSQQGFASGYDVATQLKGSLVVFSQRENQWPAHLETLPLHAARIPQFFSLYTNKQGSATGPLGRSTSAWLEANNAVSSLHARSEALIEALLSVLHESCEASWRDVFAACAAHRQVFFDSPAFPRSLYKHLAALPGFESTWTFKTSGAGGEDALILCGYEEKHLARVDTLLQQLGWSKQRFAITTGGATVQMGAAD